MGVKIWRQSEATVVLVTLSMFTGVVAAQDEVIKNNDKPVVTIQKTGMISVEKGTEAVGDHSDSEAVYEPSEKKDMTDRILVNTASRILTLYRGKEKAPCIRWESERRARLLRRDIIEWKQRK